MIADSTYIIDILKGRKPAIEKSQRLVGKDITQNLCTPVVYEIITGIEFTKSKKEKLRFNSILEDFEIFPYDLKSAQISGEVNAELIREGEERGSVDIQIASVALARGEALITSDSDFKIIGELFGLKIENY